MAPSPGLTPGAAALVAAAEASFDAARHPHLGVHHWLAALLDRHGPMAEDLAPTVHAAALRPYVLKKLGEGDAGAPLGADEVRARAAAHAAARGKTAVAERDVAAAILAAATYTLRDPAAAAAAGDGSAPPAQAEGGRAAAGDAARAAGAAYRPRSTRPTPTVEQYGRDLTREAAEGRLPPVVGREEEIALVIETLCRRTKRNPLLVGPAGVGKTAIVEGLAQRIVRGQVPDVLAGARLLAVLPSLVIAGSGVVGELQTRMKALVEEASQDGVVLFIDEVHQVVGAGGAPGTADIASFLKPALARGDVACVAATTDDEYRRFIEPDAALERRFQPIRVQELTPEQSLAVLRALRDDFRRLRGVEVADEVLAWLVRFAHQYLRNRYFPDKAVDLLEQCVAHAITQGRRAVGADDARTVAERMIGMPVDLDQRLAALRARIADLGLLEDADLHALIDRLHVTMRGMDVRPSRPNAVLLLPGAAADAADALAEALGATLFGDADRQIVIDLSRFVHPEDVTMLIGAPPGYVGYSEALPLHRLTQMPWCVLRLEQIDAAHPQIRTILTQALAEGSVTDARGRRLYLSDTVVLLTAGAVERTRRPLGFRRDDEPAARRSAVDAAAVLGEALAAQVDLVCGTAGSSAPARQRWLEAHLLAEVGRRYRAHGLHLRWDETFVRWLLERATEATNRRDWERVLDETVGPLLVPHLANAEPSKPRTLTVAWERGETTVRHEDPTTEGGV